MSSTQKMFIKRRLNTIENHMRATEAAPQGSRKCERQDTVPKASAGRKSSKSFIIQVIPAPINSRRNHFPSPSLQVPTVLLLLLLIFVFHSYFGRCHSVEFSFVFLHSRYLVIAHVSTSYINY